MARACQAEHRQAGGGDRGDQERPADRGEGAGQGGDGGQGPHQGQAGQVLLAARGQDR